MTKLTFLLRNQQAIKNQFDKLHIVVSAVKTVKYRAGEENLTGTGGGEGSFS